MDDERERYNRLCDALLTLPQLTAFVYSDADTPSTTRLLDWSEKQMETWTLLRTYKSSMNFDYKQIVQPTFLCRQFLGMTFLSLFRRY
jgi:hypothetical protein